MPRFSDRHGYQAPEKEISVREAAPMDLREAIGQLAKQAGLSFSNLRDVICDVLLAQPDQDNWSEVPNIRDEVRLNQFFRERGIGWQMEEGAIQRRGLESFTHSVKVGERSLSSTGRPHAATELAEAVRDISRRPQPDTTGAVHHAMAALEATARDVTGQTKPTLGQLIGSLDLPRPLDTAVAKLWGYASNEARHGREGSTLSTADAELIVGVSGAICGYLAEVNR